LLHDKSSPEVVRYVVLLLFTDIFQEVGEIETVPLLVHCCDDWLAGTETVDVFCSADAGRARLKSVEFELVRLGYCPLVMGLEAVGCNVVAVTFVVEETPVCRDCSVIVLDARVVAFAVLSPSF
jgi:hypothetical protein